MRSEVWRPAMRLVTAAREVRGTARRALYDPAARSSLHGLRRIIPQTEARPPAKNRHGGAPKGARPASWDAGRFASARTCRVMVRPTGCRCTRAPLGAPPTLRGGNRFHHPGAIAPRERDALFDIVRTNRRNGARSRVRPTLSRTEVSRSVEHDRPDGRQEHERENQHHCSINHVALPSESAPLLVGQMPTATGRIDIAAPVSVQHESRGTFQPSQARCKVTSLAVRILAEQALQM
jgi:hypothetical protein